MRILYVIDKPNLYGSEQHVLKLINNIKKNHFLMLLTFTTGPLLEKIDISTSKIDFKWNPIRNFKNFNTFFNLIKNEKIEIIHAHQPKALFYMSILGFICKVPVIITVHSLPVSNSQSYRNSNISFLVKIAHELIKFISEFFAYKIIYLSKFSQKTSKFKYKTIIIPNWVKNNENFKHKFLNKEKISFITIGTISYNKGSDRLLYALSLLNFKNWELNILGDFDPKFKKTFNLLLIKYQLTDKVNLIGYKEQIEHYLSQATCFILLSRAETFGLVYIEAMNLGLPIIAWNIPVTNEILPQGNLILNSCSDINSIFSTFLFSDESYYNLSKKNKRFVKNNFNESNIMDIYSNLYSNLILN